MKLSELSLSDLKEVLHYLSVSDKEYSNNGIKRYQMALKELDKRLSEIDYETEFPIEDDVSTVKTNWINLAKKSG